MKRTILIFVLPLLAAAQDRGTKVFQQSCAVGYCHGSAGSANRAPRLAGRGFEAGYVQKVVEAGIPNTAMPAFKAVLPAADLAAVIKYVNAISGGAGPAAAPAPTAAAPAAPAQNIPADAKRGKDLFFDPIRGTRCSTCHSVDGMGVAVGPNLAAAPPRDGATIKNVTARDIQTASTDGDQFPALAVEKTAAATRLYDLTTPPPVLRTFAANQVSLSPGNWSHAAAISSYSTSDLDAVAKYLNWLSKQ